MNKVIIIYGVSGSGKTTCARMLNEMLCDSVIISQDSYYKGEKNNSINNFDIPSAIDFDLLRDHMNDLIKGKEVLTPKYDFSTHSRIGEEVVYPSEYIILEGTLLGADRKLMELASCRIFCDTDIDICLLRRIDRDIRERGRDIVSIFQQYETQVKPSISEHIMKYSHLADIKYYGRNIEQLYQRIKYESSPNS